MMPAPVSQEEPLRGSAGVLIIDDRRENLLSLEATLRTLDQEVVAVTSGRAALRALMDREFAVILLDVNLPGMDGYETATLIRSRDRSRHTPIIFLTAIDRNDLHESRGYALGAVDFLFKPFNPDILRAKVSVFIELFRKSQEIKKLNEDLERRVQQRTVELQAANRGLQAEVEERRRMEAEVRELNVRLEERVRARTAELEEANAELEAFSYSVSHDLRAPLRKIEGFSNLLLEDHALQLDPEVEEYLKRIGASSRQMGQIIDDMLLLSRVTHDELEYEPVDLSRLAREIVEDLRSAPPGERNVEVGIQDRVVVQGDPRLLRFALKNLLENAWKFTSKKEKASITFGMMQQQGNPVYYVKDNGAGFDMKYVNEMFDPFRRLHPTRDYPGTGIGLAIVQRVIRRHGGRVWTESEPGKGASFYFTL